MKYKIDYVVLIESFLNPEGYQNRISGSKVTVILLKGLILPIGGVHWGRVHTCSLLSRLVYSEDESLAVVGCEAKIREPLWSCPARGT